MALEVQRLSVTAPDGGRPLLDDISCSFRDGELTLVVGRNGAGKSTLLDALGGLIEFGGDMRLDGKPLNREGSDQQELRRIGRLFQYPENQLFARTVRAECLYSLSGLRLSRRDREQAIVAAVSRMGLPPEILEQSPLWLSGGQKRRVALASTLVVGHDWLLLDEPTAGLDADASARLLDEMQERKRERRGGIVVATHDLELLLPLADRIILLRDGQLVAALSAAELARCPQWWVRAGLEPPASARLAAELRDAGLEPPERGLTADELSELLLSNWRAAGSPRDTNEDAKRGTSREIGAGASIEAEAEAEAGADANAKTDSAAAAAFVDVQQQAGLPGSRSSNRRRRYAESLDPRAKWALYMGLSIGLLTVDNWLGAGTGLLMTAVLVWLCQVPVSGVWRILRPFVILSAITIVLSGLSLGGESAGEVNAASWHFGAASFDPAAASRTALQLGKVLLVMVGGLLLAATTTPFAMKRGMERMLAPLAGIRFPVEAVSLTTSLLLRFLPVLRREAIRFRRIVKSRGRRLGRRGRIRLADLPAMLVPLLLSLLQLASDLSLALESRGYTLERGARRTYAVPLQMTRFDWWTAATGVLCMVLLIVLFS